MNMIYIIISIGIIAGLIHQLIDRGKKNSSMALLRGAIVGGVTAALTFWAIPSNTVYTMGNSLYATIFTASYMADNIVLNSSERAKIAKMAKEEESSFGKELVNDAKKAIENEIDKQ